MTNQNIILLDQETINLELLKLKDWCFNDNAIEKKFKFDTFTQALGFIVQTGCVSEKKNHHPEFYNIYNKVTIRLTTHDAKGVTEKDIDLAKAIDNIS